MAVTTPRALVSDYNNYCIQSGLDPAVILNYTATITSFGGTGNTTYGDFGGVKGHASNVPSIILPWDCLIVGVGVKYVQHNSTVTGAGSIAIQAAVSATAAQGATANFASVGELVAFSNAELTATGTNAAKSATGLSIALSAGSCLAVRCVATGAVDNGDSDSQLVINFQLAVPQSKFALPTTQS
tara:strand:- start:1619 stop:2173 length:555 start_codon:yes stop_codon:yes gene_type:complete